MGAPGVCVCTGGADAGGAHMGMCCCVSSPVAFVEDAAHAELQPRERIHDDDADAARPCPKLRFDWSPITEGVQSGFCCGNGTEDATAIEGSNQLAKKGKARVV